MKQLIVCLTPLCTWSSWERTDNENLKKHMSNQPGLVDFKLVNPPPVVLKDPKSEVQFDRIRWNVEEATLDSAVFTNHVDRTQTVSVRLVLSRGFPNGKG